MIRSAAIAIAVLVSLPAAQAATQAQLDTMRAKSLAYLVAQQKGDGSWRDASGSGVQATASGIEALAQSGMRTGYVPGAAISWLLNAEAPSTDSMARQIAALARLGVKVEHLVPQLLANKNLLDGRWGAYRAYQASMPDTALAFDALLAADYSVPTDAELVAITGMKAADGGWAYRISAPDGAKSAVIPTAYAVLVLSRYVVARSSATTASSPSITDGINWLLARKKNDGGFAEDANAAGTHDPATPGQVFETALVQSALATAKQANIAAAQTPAASLALTNIDDFLVARQGVDGGWSADPFQTALAARAQPAVMLADTDLDGLPNAVEPYLSHNAAVADSRDLPKGNGNPNNPAAAPSPVYYKPPVLTADSTFVVGGHSTKINVLANDNDPSGGSLTLVSVTNGAHGVAQIEGQEVKYLASDTYSGTDVLSYTARNSKGATANASVIVTVYAKSGDEDGDNLNNYDEVSVGRDIFINENAVVILLIKQILSK